MTLTFGAVILIAIGSAFGFWMLMMMAPFRRAVLACSWFIDVAITVILVQIFHKSTAGMAIAMIGGATFSVLRWATCRIMKVEDIFAFMKRKLSEISQRISQVGRKTK